MGMFSAARRPARLGTRHPTSRPFVGSAFITGAAGGIGTALARRLAPVGWRLTLVDIDGDRLRRLVEELCADGAEVQPLVADLGTIDSVRGALDAAVQQWGGVDLVLPFAGLFVESTATASPEVTALVRAVNLWQPLACAELALRRAEERGAACTVVMPLSDAGLEHRDPWIYARAKAELHARSGELARRWRTRPEMRVLRAVVYPTRTEFFVNSDSILESQLGPLPSPLRDHDGIIELLRRAPDPEWVADEIVRAVDRGDRWLYLEPRDHRRVAWVKGEVSGFVVDHLPGVVRRRFGILPRTAVPADPQAALTGSGG